MDEIEMTHPTPRGIERYPSFRMPPAAIRFDC